jgi:NADH-quinone oxidoreductase subunit L
MPYIAAAVAAFAAGVGGAWWVYVTKKGEPARAFTEGAPGFTALVRDKWRVDEFYEETFVGAIDTLAVAATWVDKWIVDGIVARLSAFVVAVFGTMLRYLQVGRVQAYALSMVIGLGAFGWYFFVPSAEARVIPNHATGAYSVTAAPGLGYEYRWDENGDGKWETEKFGSKSELALELKPGEARKVRLQVRNAFYGTAAKVINVERPKVDASGATPSEQSAIDKARARPQRPHPGMPGAPSGAAQPRPLAPPTRPQVQQ